MAIRTVVTRGYGNGTFNGTIAELTTRGYTIGEAVAEVAGGGGLPPPFGARVIPLRRQKEAVEDEILVVEAALEKVEATLAPEIDLAAIADSVEREIAELLRITAEKEREALEQRLQGLRARRLWLIRLLEDAAIILLSAA